jgi:hypothetical protein
VAAVRHTGDDAKPGTEAQPLATIQAAVNKLQPGDTLLIRGGVYQEPVTFPTSGAAEKPILIDAKEVEMPRGQKKRQKKPVDTYLMDYT